MVSMGVSAAPGYLVEQAQHLIARQERYARIWPDFWPVGQSFLLYGSNGACVLYSPQQTPEGFEPAGESSSGLWQGTCEGTRFAGPMWLLARVGGVPTHAVRVDRSSKDVESLVVHEAFHAHQRCAFQPEPWGIPTFDFALDVDWVRSKLRETLLLFEAVAQQDEPARWHLARMVLALRQQRLEAMPRSAGETEDHYMRSEGTATFVAYRANDFGAGAELAKRMAEGAMRTDLPSLSWEWLLRWQSYETGAAAAVLLDLAEWPEWRQRVARGESLYRLLAEASAFNPAETRPLTEQAMLQPLPSVERVVGALVKQRDVLEKVRKRYRSAARHRLQIRPSGAGMGSLQASRMGSIDGRTVVFDPNPFVSEDDEMAIRISGRPILLGKAPDDSGASLIEVALARAPKIEGCNLADSEGLCPAGSRIVAGRAQLALKQPARVRQTPEVTLVWSLSAGTDPSERPAECPSVNP
ncbi:MAG TPA: hypothetical protein DDZ76_08495 [Xanthomonadales bacterium]|nr:hypothetical protein [Xanthomonadales bacterium]